MRLMTWTMDGVEVVGGSLPWGSSLVQRWPEVGSSSSFGAFGVHDWTWGFNFLMVRRKDGEVSR